VFLVHTLTQPFLGYKPHILHGSLYEPTEQIIKTNYHAAWQEWLPHFRQKCEEFVAGASLVRQTYHFNFKGSSVVRANLQLANLPNYIIQKIYNLIVFSFFTFFAIFI